MASPNSAGGIWASTGRRDQGRIRVPLWRFRKRLPIGLLAAEGRADQYKHFDIENAAAELLRAIDVRASA
jgi:hypothetical protein